MAKITPYICGCLSFICVVLYTVEARISHNSNSNNDNGIANGKNLIENAFLKLSKLNDMVATDVNAAADGGGHQQHQVPCTCGVFLSGQFNASSAGSPPRGNAALMHEQDVLLPCNAHGKKQCTNRCLEMVSGCDS